MENLKKFDKKGLFEEIRSATNKMSYKEAFQICDGVYKLYKIVFSYFMKTNKGVEEMQRLYEYVVVLQGVILKREKEEEVPY